MAPPGPPASLGRGQPVTPSLLRANSGLLCGQESGMPSQNTFPSLVSPRNQFNNMNMVGNIPNVSSFLHQSFGNGGPSSGLSGPESSQRGLFDGRAESDPLPSVGNGMGCNQPSSSYMSSPITSIPNSSGQVQGQQQFSNLTDHQLDPQNFQPNQQQLQQFSLPNNNQQQQQFQTMRPGLGGAGPVKLYPQVDDGGAGPVKLYPQVDDEQGPQQLQALSNLGPVKLEPQQLQTMSGLGSVKTEPLQSDLSLFLHHHQQQQQQQHLHLSRQSSQAAAAAAQIFRQQRLSQIQQQQLLKFMPQQRSSLQPQFQHQNLPVRSPVKPVYEPGMCARRLTNYMYQQQHRPEDNNIEFWRKFVAEYFAPGAKKKWCISMYGSGRQPTGVFLQDVWHCEICNRKPGRGFEATAHILPRLFKMKYESGTLEELLHVDMPREYQNSSGQIVLDYAKAIQESVFEQLRVVRDGQLRIVFSPDLKICSWEFCARRHEELVPKRLLIPQVSQLGAAAQKCQAATSNASSSASFSDLQNNCNMFVASARQLAKALEVPLVNDLGYTKRYVRFLQISEVVNSMMLDLIDYSNETGTGPMESLVKFPQRTEPGFQCQPQENEGHLQQQQTMVENTSNPAQATVQQLATINTINSVPMVSLLYQNSINSRHENRISGSNSPYVGNSAHLPSPDSSGIMPQTKPTPPNVLMQQPSASSDADVNEPLSSVQKIIHDMMMSSQLGGAGMMMSMGTSGNMKNVNEISLTNNTAAMNGTHCLVGHGVANGQSTVANGVRGNNGLSMNGRAGQQSLIHHQQDFGNQLPNGNSHLTRNHLLD